MAPPLPDLVALLGPFLERLPARVHPRFLAALERRAAERYLAWAAGHDDAGTAAGLRAAAEREVAIASHVEDLFPEAAGDADLLVEVVREVAEGFGALLQGRALREQLAIQAAGERAGAATWRRLATRETDPGRRAVLERCAMLEEESARFLEATLAGTDARGRRSAPG
jgi:hypothetical protein